MKAMKGVTFLLLFNTIIFASLQTGRAKKYEIQLQPSKFNFSISLQQILQVAEKKQVITMNLWRSLFWKDDFLIIMEISPK